MITENQVIFFVLMYSNNRLPTQKFKTFLDGEESERQQARATFLMDATHFT